MSTQTLDRPKTAGQRQPLRWAGVPALAICICLAGSFWASQAVALGASRPMLFLTRDEHRLGRSTRRLKRFGLTTVSPLAIGILFGVLGPPLTNGALADDVHSSLVVAVPTCGNWHSVIDGTPEVTSNPAIASVQLSPLVGGVIMTVRFSKSLRPAPEGVYFAWDVYLFHERADAAAPDQATILQIEDRGRGWQPVGWTVLESTQGLASLIDERIGSDDAHNELVAYFPTRQFDTRKTFYWYASQEAYRVYMPDGKGPDWSVNGSVTAYCPPGAQPDPYVPALPAKLLEFN